MSPDLLAGRYELTERIAGGGMGQVWRGRDRVLERIVAVKTVDLSTQDATMKERFRREAVATAGLSAPNIVQVFDAGTDGNTAYLVMELLTGPSLSQIIHDHGPLSINEGIHVSREVARALLTAHRIGVVHRDIKPGNVMYHHDQVKLVDFGIAQLQRDMGAPLTAPATALGTAAYMSPEQAAGEGATEKSDWYALGCLMTTMFTGKPPFEGEPLAIATQQINAKPPYLSERRSETPTALDRLVAAMLAKEPADRPSGDDIVEQLRLLEADPNAGTILMPSAPRGDDPAATRMMGSTAVLPAGAAGETGPRRTTFMESPSEPPAPVRPVAPPPPLRSDEDDRGEDRRPAWPWVVLVAAVLALLIGGGYLLMNRNDSGGEVGASPSPTPTATTQTTTTRPPTTTRAPRTTTQAPTTTRPPRTIELPSLPPLPTIPRPTQDSGDTGSGKDSPDGNSGDGNSGNGNSGDDGSTNGDAGNSDTADDTAVQNAIAEVDSRAARTVLNTLWVEAKVSGNSDLFVQGANQLAQRGLITASESESLRQSARAYERG